MSLTALSRWALNKPLLAGASAIAELPNDPALPALAAIRSVGLACAIPALGLDDSPIHFVLHRYHSGRRAAIEARAGTRHLAIKLYAEDPSPEAKLHEALASVGFAGNSGARVPPLLAWDRDLRVLAIGWLDGPSAAQLIKSGQGKRAGALAAVWLQRAASLEVKLGLPLGAALRMERARKWATTLVAADPALANDATTVVELLSRTQPNDTAPRLVHGGLYADHVLDLGDGPGVIDWGRFGQGPAELDAGIFLATIWRLGFRDESLLGEVACAEQVFLAGTAGLLDERALAWYRAVELLRFAKKADCRNGRWPIGAQHALLRQSARLVDAAQ